MVVAPKPSQTILKPAPTVNGRADGGVFEDRPPGSSGILQDPRPNRRPATTGNAFSVGSSHVRVAQCSLTQLNLAF